MVTTATPMKRGLKDATNVVSSDCSTCYNRYPDEKGTERTFHGSFLLRFCGYNRYPDEKGTERWRTIISPISHQKVTTATPMKRGLKAKMQRCFGVFYQYVTTATPMKRGLKESKADRSIQSRQSYNRYPDEKGTESTHERTLPLLITSYNRYPDEKGTESCEFFSSSPPVSGYNRYPDEKGTESLSLAKFSTTCLSYNRYPDEKGTESGR